MKRYYKAYFLSRCILSILFSLLFLNNAFSQWTNINSPSKYQFQSVFFSSASIGYIGGAEGTYKSIDGGNIWTKIKYTKSDSTYLEGINEQHIHFIDDTIGIIAGWNVWDNNEVIIKTTDGGSNWSVKQKGAFETGLKSISFPNDTIGYVAGLNGRILKTINGGNTWSALSTGTTNDLYGIYFTDINTGYAVGDNVILKTTNGGSSWSINSNISNIFYSVYFINGLEGYVGTVFGEIFKTIDGGNTWSNSTILQNTSINRIFFINDSVGYLAMGFSNSNNGEIFKTSSYGKYWEPMPSANDTLMLKDVFFKSQNEGFAVGENGVIKHTTNAGGNTIPVAKFISNTTVYCQGDSVVFYNHTNPNCTFSWLLNDTIISSVYNLKIKLVNDTTNTITLIANNGFATDTAKLVFKVGKKLTSIPIICKAIDDSICDGTSSSIQVFSSDTAAVYTLKKGTSIITQNVKGNGGILNFNLGQLYVYNQLTTINIYSIEATKQTDCNVVTSKIDYKITIFPKPLHKLILNTPNTILCTKDTATIILSSSKQGLWYQLKDSRNGGIVGKKQPGNGGDITFQVDSLTKLENIRDNFDSDGYNNRSFIKKYYVIESYIAGCFTDGPTSWNSIQVTSNVFKVDFNLPSFGVYLKDTLSFEKIKPMYKYNHNWFFNGASITSSTDSLPSFISYPNVGTYQIKLVGVSQSKNCIDSIEKTLEVFNPPPNKPLLGSYCWKNSTVDSTNNFTLLAQHIDKDGNLYVTGYEYIDGFNYHLVIFKFNKFGNLMWKHNSGWKGPRIIFGNVITSDTLGNLYIGGALSNATDFTLNDTSVITTGLNPNDYRPRMFLFKFNPDGAYIWSIMDLNSDNGGGDPTGISDILIDKNQNLYLSTLGVYSLKFADGSVKQMSQFSQCFSIIKIDSDGKYINQIDAKVCQPYGNTSIIRSYFSVDNGSNGYFMGPKIKMSSQGKIILYGAYHGNKLEFGGNILEMKIDNTLNCNNIGINGFIAVCDTTGNGSWINAFHTFESENLYVNGFPMVDLDNNDNIYLTGNWGPSENCSLYPSKFILGTDTLMVNNRRFLAKYDLNGNNLWHKFYKTTNPHEGLVVSNNNHIFIMTNYHDNYYLLSSDLEPPVGLKNGTGHLVFLNEFDENGSLVGVDYYPNKYTFFNYYRGSVLLSKDRCGDIYLTNTTSDITIDSTRFFDSYELIVSAKYSVDKQCKKHNCIPVTVPSIFADGNKEICFGEKMDLSWDAFYINKVNIILSTNAGNNIDTVATNYNANAPSFEYVINKPAGLSSFIIQDEVDNAVADTVNFMLHPKPTITASNDTSICDEIGKTITLKASSNGSGNSYQWQPGNLSGSIINVTPANSATTTYTVNVTTQYGCKNLDSVKVISELSLCPNVSINNILNNNEILITSKDDLITIASLGDKNWQFDNLYLSDISGKIVYSEKNIILFPGEQKQISSNLFSSGVYILTLYSDEKSVRSKISIIR